MERVYDKHEQLVKEYEPGTIRGRKFIMPFRLSTLRFEGFKYPEIWRQEGGRVEFERDSIGDWIETSRKYETWYHNPHTGETWGREPVNREHYYNTWLEWNYEK